MGTVTGGELTGKRIDEKIITFAWNITEAVIILVLFCVIERDTHLAIGIAAYILANMVWSAVKQLFQ